MFSSNLIIFQENSTVLTWHAAPLLLQLMEQSTFELRSQIRHFEYKIHHSTYRIHHF